MDYMTYLQAITILIWWNEFHLYPTISNLQGSSFPNKSLICTHKT